MSRIFFDASLIGVALTLQQNDDRVIYPGHPDWPFSQDSPDEEWLRYVGVNDWCAILRDKRIRYRPSERAVLLTYRVRLIVIATHRNLTIAESAALLKRYWGGVEDALSGPPSYRHLTLSGMTTMLDYGGEFGD